MTINAPISLTLFRPDGVIMLADVRAQAELLLEGNARRDMLSAFNVLQARAGIDLGATPAAARSVRELFDALAPASLGVSAKRYANIRSLIVRAVDRFGMKRTRLTSRVPLTAAWEALLDRVENGLRRGSSGWRTTARRSASRPRTCAPSISSACMTRSRQSA